MIRLSQAARFVVFASLALAARSPANLRAQDPSVEATASEESADPTRRPDAAREASEPRLLFATDEVFVHFVQPEPSREMARWDIERYGDLLVTQRDDGAMVRLLSARLEALPTRRQKFVETRISAVGVHEGRLVATIWRTITWDRPPAYGPRGERLDQEASEPPAPRFVSVWVYSLAEEKVLANVDLTEEDQTKLLDLPLVGVDLTPAALTSEQSAKLLELFDQNKLGREAQP